MNTNHQRIRFPAIFVLAALAGTLATPAIVRGQAAASGKLRTVATESKDNNNDKDKSGFKESIEIRINDGKVSVSRNGTEVTGGEIKFDNGNVIILDKDGHEVKEFHLGDVAGKAGQFKYWIGDAARKYAPMIEGFADESDDAAETAVPKVMLGVQMSEPGPALEYHLGLAPRKTIMISGVFEGLAADEAGLKPYDIIMKVDGRELPEEGGMRAALADKNPGDAVSLTIIHEGKSKEFKVKLKKYDAEEMKSAKMLGGTGEQEFALGGGGQGLWRTLQLPELHGKYLQELGQLPQMKHLFVTPGVDLRGQLEWAKPEIERRLREHAESDKHQDDGNTDAQLERLDKRMADLERLLQKLIEKQGGGR